MIKIGSRASRESAVSVRPNLAGITLIRSVIFVNQTSRLN
jgi:hypothetical protein